MKKKIIKSIIFVVIYFILGISFLNMDMSCLSLGEEPTKATFIFSIVLAIIYFVGIPVFIIVMKQLKKLNDISLEEKIVKETVYEHFLGNYLNENKITKEQYQEYLNKYINNEDIGVLNEDEKNQANEYINKKIELRKKYVSSKLNTLLKVGIICLDIGVVLSLFTIIVSFIKNDTLKNIQLFTGIIGVVCLIIFWYSRQAKKHCCPSCGTKGEKIGSHLDSSSVNIEKKLITSDSQMLNAKGRLTRVKDSKGNLKLYEEQLVTTNKYTDDLVCPYCEETWQLKRVEKI